VRKVSVNLSLCRPGMHMAETIYNEHGAIIIGQNTILDEHLIHKLRRLNIASVKVFDDENNMFKIDSTEVFTSEYKENLEVVKDILHDISTGKNIDAEKVNHVSDSVFQKINENRDIVGCINQIRDIGQYTYTHSVNVSLISMLIGKWMKFDEDKIKKLVLAGLLHDIGKGRISQDILNKPGSLTEDEFEEIKMHSVYGFRVAETELNLPKDVCAGILMHHEREDGSGYPMGIKGDQIHPFAKVIAIADVYDAMTSNRVYKKKESPFEVLELMEERSLGYLDAIALNAFLTNIAAYYIGDTVLLSSGALGEIVYINPRHISKPLVRVGNEFIDLAVNNKIKVLELI
jgi:putative nucleotidyltransferase with HDIG domain